MRTTVNAKVAKGALLAALVLAGAPGCMAYRQNPVTGKFERHPTMRAVLSALLPGAGQIVNEQRGQAALLLTVEVLNHVTYYRVDGADRNDERYFSVLALTRLWAATDAYDAARVLNETQPLQPAGAPRPEVTPAPASGTSSRTVHPNSALWTPLFSIDPLGRRMTAGLSCRF